MPLQATSGAASYDAFGGGVPVVPAYIEEVFSTYLYTNNGGAITIDNGIDLSGKGGLLWEKQRNGTGVNQLVNSATGASKYLVSNSTDSQQNGSGVTFTSTGFSYTAGWNGSMASWTFRKQPKFFDVVTWTGNSSGASTRAIPHNLGSTPGFIIVKVLNATSDWVCNHRSLGSNTILLNLTAASSAVGDWGTIDSSVFTVTNVGNGLNFTGQQYVAYLFAHDAGGFGLTGTDNVISCGSFTPNASEQATINLGYEPQWVLYKQAGGSGGNWDLYDSMRGMAVTGTTRLFPNLSDAEVNQPSINILSPTATGFNVQYLNQFEHIYIAIRRGPMKVPTVGTSVFAPIAVTNSAGSNNTTNFPVDLQINSLRSAASKLAVDRLRGVSTTDTNIGSQLATNSTAAEAGSGAGSITRNWSNTGFQTSDEYGSLSTIYWNFGRAPSFFDEVCWTANVTDPTTMTVNHNLGVAPQMIIKKARQTNGVSNTWRVYHIGLNGGVNPQNAVIRLDSNGAETVVTPDWGDTAPTATQFTAGYVESGYTYVAYLFATCAGVSKVGSYTGTGTTLQVNCGFTSGSRFVLIKRTDSTGDWYVWDSARGIVSGNDPYLLLNSTAAEVTNTDYIDTYSAGFEISSTAPAGINASAGTYIFLAIA